MDSETNARKIWGFLQEILHIWSHLEMESRAVKLCVKQCSVSFLSSFFPWREKGS